MMFGVFVRDVRFMRRSIGNDKCELIYIILLYMFSSIIIIIRVIVVIVNYC